jgi:transaldolase/glucose-6-phosphate isomerase
MALPADFTTRFWAKDGTLWSDGKYGDAVTGFLGWLDVARTMKGRVAELSSFVAEVRAAGFERVVLAGMGGSSLAPLVLHECLALQAGPGNGGDPLPFAVLDSTDPGTVLRIERLGPVEKALFVIASKSGSTAEPNAFNDYFYAAVKRVKGDAAGENFAAITDPGSPFEAAAKAAGFRKIFLNFADIGGRYSALSYFGLVPAALMGLDVDKLLDRAIAVCEANGPGTAVDAAPAVALGKHLGELAQGGRDKLTFLLPEKLRTLGLWFEQLVAESTGKEGKGILPVALEEAGPPSVYGPDRVFAYIRERHEDPASTGTLGSLVADLRDAGSPVIDVAMEDLYDIGAEFMRWEIATAVAGAVIGINPFDQPNVQESKDVTKKYVHEVETQGSLPVEAPDVSGDGLKVYGIGGKTPVAAFHAFLVEVQECDYVGLQAYLMETEPVSHCLRELQAKIRDHKKVAVTNGYGPRFLHSTGQFHKGGPNTGHFIQFTQADAEDAPLPGKGYTFGVFRNAQARGDRETLLSHHRRVICIDLGADPRAALESLLYSF